MTGAALAQQIEGLMAKINTNAGPSLLSLHAMLEHEPFSSAQPWSSTEVGLEEALSDHLHCMTLHTHQG